MSTKIHSNNFAALAIVIVAFFGATLIGVLNARAQSSITYPVVELGNCENKADCRSYCDVDGPFSDDLSDEERSQRRSACQNFASQHRKSNVRNLENANKINDKLNSIKKDGGPGGECGKAENPIAACKAFCDRSSNIPVCVEYAKKHGLFEGKELEEAEKVARALERGIKLPASCKDSDSCQSVCENPKDVTVAKQCFAFAKEAGLLPPGFDEGKAEKFFQAMENKNGTLNFQDMRKCERPENDDVLEKCIQIGLDSGFITAEQAEMMKRTKGKGPGGCRGEECRTYCETEEHQEECMRFSEEHGLMGEEEKARQQREMDQFRKFLSEAPEKVKTCLKDTLGEAVLNDLQSGAKRPSRDLGEKMRTCFDNYFRSRDNMSHDEFNGDGGDMNRRNNMRGMMDSESREYSDRPMEPQEGTNSNKVVPMMRGNSMPNRFPDVVVKCVESKVGAEVARKLADPRTGRPSPEQEKIIGECMTILRKQGLMQGNSTSERSPTRPYQGGTNMPNGDYGPDSHMTPEEMRAKYESGSGGSYRGEFNKPPVGDYPNQMPAPGSYRPSPEEMQRYNQNSTGGIYQHPEMNQEMPPSTSGSYIQPPPDQYSPESGSYENVTEPQMSPPPLETSPTTRRRFNMLMSNILYALIGL